jgi:hypothetical protein
MSFKRKFDRLEKLEQYILKRYNYIYQEEGMEENYIDAFFDAIKSKLKKEV